MATNLKKKINRWYIPMIYICPLGYAECNKCMQISKIGGTPKLRWEGRELIFEREN